MSLRHAVLVVLLVAGLVLWGWGWWTGDPWLAGVGGCLAGFGGYRIWVAIRRG